MTNCYSDGTKTYIAQTLQSLKYHIKLNLFFLLGVKNVLFIILFCERLNIRNGHSLFSF